jgi:hypothetical protein
MPTARGASLTSLTSTRTTYLCQYLWRQQLASAKTLARGASLTSSTSTPTLPLSKPLAQGPSLTSSATMTTHLCQHIGIRAFTIIFGHYNNSRAFVDTFGVNVYDDLPSPPSLRGYINSFGTKVHFTFLKHFGSRGTPTTSLWTFTYAIMDTMTMSTTTSTTKYLVTSASQEELREHTRGPDTLEGEVFCSMLMREDLEASQQPSAKTTTCTSIMMTTHS